MTIYQRLNRIISDFPCVLIEHKEGKVFLLKEHWKYLNPYKQAQRICIGKGQVSQNQYQYITELFPCFQRTRFICQKPITTTHISVENAQEQDVSDVNGQEKLDFRFRKRSTTPPLQQLSFITELSIKPKT